MTIKVTAILATNDDFLIGYGDNLPWKCSPDLKRFKDLSSTGDWVVMGYNTYKGFCETWPTKNILPERKVCVLYSGGWASHETVMFLPEKHGKTFSEVVGFDLSKLPKPSHLFLVTALLLNSKTENVNIIGGAKTFEMFAPIITDIELTRIITPENYTPHSPPINPIHLGPAMRGGAPQLEHTFEMIKGGILTPSTSDKDERTGVKCEFYTIKL